MREMQFLLGMSIQRHELEGGIGSYISRKKIYQNTAREEGGEPVERVYFDKENLKIKFEEVK